jgi:drug/metabolite transporter (DMT)-like permease
MLPLRRRGTAEPMSQVQSTLGSPDRNVTGILFVLIGALAFTVQDIIVKYVSDGYSIHQIVLLRGLGALPLIVGLFLYDGGIGKLGGVPLGLVTLRSAIQYLSFVLWFLGIATMSIADALAIGFISPLIITGLSSLVLGARIGVARWLAILAGFAGAIVMLRPGFGVFEPAALLILVSAICYAAGAILTRKIGTGASSATMGLNSLVLSMTVSAGAGLIASGGFGASSHPSAEMMLRAWAWPDVTDASLMLSAGVMAGIGMITVAQAYRVSEPAVIAPFEYTSMIWAVIAGYAIWHQVPDAVSIAGTLFIVGAGLYVVSIEGLRNRRRA